MSKPTIFSERIILTRTKLQLSQESLAKKASMAPAAISHFETGARKPSFDNLRRLADVLDVTADYLLGRTDDPHGFAKADAAFRHGYSELSADQKEFALDMIKRLAEQNKPKT